MTGLGRAAVTSARDAWDLPMADSYSHQGHTTTAMTCSYGGNQSGGLQSCEGCSERRKRMSVLPLVQHADSTAQRSSNLTDIYRM